MVHITMQVPEELANKIQPIPVFVKKAKRSKLKNEPFIGMWKDRDDMSDSVAWVRELRRWQ